LSASREGRTGSNQGVRACWEDIGGGSDAKKRRGKNGNPVGHFSRKTPSKIRNRDAASNRFHNIISKKRSLRRKMDGNEKDGRGGEKEKT